MKRVLNAPVWVGELFTGAKSFAGNPLIGSRRLNRLGLHVGRIVLGYGVMRLRMAMLAWGVSREDRQQFQREGYICKEDFLPREAFAALEREVRTCRGEVRECCQGDTRTHRILLSPETLAELPQTAALLKDRGFRRLLRYCAGHLRLPICHIEQVHNGSLEGVQDPQKMLHIDTFQPTMKFWLYLDDVSDSNGPFHYVPGSNRPTFARLKWEYAMSQQARDHRDRYTARGSFRVPLAQAPMLGSAPPKAFRVRANTLLIANTFGVHARGQAVPGSSRLALWGMSRTNPFLPLPGLGFESFNRLQYRVLQRMRLRDDQRAAARGGVASWHCVEKDQNL